MSIYNIYILYIYTDDALKLINKLILLTKLISKY